MSLYLDSQKRHQHLSIPQDWAESICTTQRSPKADTLGEIKGQNIKKRSNKSEQRVGGRAVEAEHVGGLSIDADQTAAEKIVVLKLET